MAANTYLTPEERTALESARVGIAGAGGEHLTVLANVARALEDDNVIAKLRTTDDVDWILKVLS